MNAVLWCVYLGLVALDPIYLFGLFSDIIFSVIDYHANVARA
jgi:hypothetical protein